MFLLDTNVCVEIIRGRPDHVRERFRRHVKAGHEIFISTITSFELWYGAEKSDHPEANRKKTEFFLNGPLALLEFDEEDSRAAGSIRARLELEGRMIGPFDTLLAGQALRRNLILVTGNTREFSRIHGLQTENWNR